MMDTTEKLYKWLRSDRTTPVQGVKWPKRVGAWTAEETPVLCKSGWHGVEAKDAMEHFESGLVLWEVEVRGDRVNGGGKFAVASMRLVREIGSPTDKTLRLLACDIAEDVLHFYEKKYPKDSRVRDCIAVARRYANGEATEEDRAAARDAARAAARAAAWDAAWAAAWAKYSQWLVDAIEAQS